LASNPARSPELSITLSVSALSVAAKGPGCHLILNPEETGKITEVIAEGEYYGMRTFDQSLLRYVMEGKVAEQVVLDYASSPHDLS
jgi:Tfp pilus assembly pilus retraction ATPase PilT